MHSAAMLSQTSLVNLFDNSGGDVVTALCAASELSATTASRSSSSLASKPWLNLADRSEAHIRSFSVLRASSREKLRRLPPVLPSSEIEELHAVLSVHSVPHKDSRSSVEIGLQSPGATLGFSSTELTARSALSIASIVFAASAFFLLLPARGRGARCAKGGGGIGVRGLRLPLLMVPLLSLR